MNEQIELSCLQKGVGLSISTGQDQKLGNTIEISGDTFRVKEFLKSLGFTFRHGEHPWLGSYWAARDSLAIRAATQTQFPAASGWNWLPEFGRKGIEL